MPQVHPLFPLSSLSYGRAQNYAMLLLDLFSLGRQDKSMCETHVQDRSLTPPVSPFVTTHLEQVTASMCVLRTSIY